MTVFRHMLRGFIIGATVGIAMSLPVWFGYIGSSLAKTPLLGKLHNTLNFPAGALAVLWTEIFRFPPRGEAAWIVVPAVAIVLQWMLVGVGLDLSGALLHSYRKPTAP